MKESEKTSYFEKIRNSWDAFSFKSPYGSFLIKILSTLIVFVSVFISVKFAGNVKGSLVCSFFEWVRDYTENVSMVVFGIEMVVAIIWFFTSELGTLFVAIIMFASYAGFSPLTAMLAFVLLLTFAGEDKPVIAMMSLLPVVTFLTPLNLGILFVTISAFVSLRKNDGPIKALGFVYFALLELCNGGFGTISNSKGTQIVPRIEGASSVIQDIKYVFTELSQGEYQKDEVFGQIIIVLAVYLVIGFIFTSMINSRYSNKKISIDVMDAVIFAVLLILICIATEIIITFTVMKSFSYSYLSIGLQLLFAYILTRPVAGRSPRRQNPIFSEGKGFIFISYAHADLDRIKPYLKLLDKKGYEFWYDDNIKTGTEWQDIIASNLANSTCFIAFVSTSSITSEYCLKEINYATSKKKPTAVIMIDSVILPPVLEMHFASLQVVKRSLYGSDEECLDKVLEMEEFNDCKYEKQEEL